jgi:hypothetical protein
MVAAPPCQKILRKQQRVAIAAIQGVEIIYTRTPEIVGRKCLQIVEKAEALASKKLPKAEEDCQW